MWLRSAVTRWQRYLDSASHIAIDCEGSTGFINCMVTTSMRWICTAGTLLVLKVALAVDTKSYELWPFSEPSELR
jgi:hypothetical protein